jgi:hypothetical protein
MEHCWTAVQANIIPIMLSTKPPVQSVAMARSTVAITTPPSPCSSSKRQTLYTYGCLQYLKTLPDDQQPKGTASLSKHMTDSQTSTVLHSHHTCAQQSNCASMSPCKSAGRMALVHFTCLNPIQLSPKTYSASPETHSALTQTHTKTKDVHCPPKHNPPQREWQAWGGGGG